MFAIYMHMPGAERLREEVRGERWRITSVRSIAFERERIRRRSSLNKGKGKQARRMDHGKKESRELRAVGSCETVSPQAHNTSFPSLLFVGAASATGGDHH
jgi:hypothetical protein